VTRAWIDANSNFVPDCDLLNRGVTPQVPSQGSVGASGDLAPLAHMALVLIGEGKPVVLCAVDWIGIGNDGRPLQHGDGTRLVHALH
jgi:hypothetical protein